MRSIRYRGYARHKQIHDTFRDQTLVSLKKTLELSDYSPAAAHRFLGVLLGWLTGHIMAEDQDITGQRSPAPVYAYSFDTSIIAQAIDHTMQDVFRMEANLINNSYDGRKMGMGFFCRLCYTMSNGGKIQLLFAAEEQLLRRAVGLIFGLHAMRNAEMVHEVSLQIFEQFLHHMGRLFKSDATYELYKEEVLTGDEFRSDFMTRYPCSLLFETRLGYFVFCARKWQARGRKVFVP